MREKPLNRMNAADVFNQDVKLASNTALYQTLCSAGQHTDLSSEAGCAMPPGYRLIRVDRPPSLHSHGFEIALINDADASVAYYHRVAITSPASNATLPVTRHQTFQSPIAKHAVVLKGFSGKVLFNYVLSHYVVLVNLTHTRFWEHQASRALALGAHVYHYQQACNHLQPIATQQALKILLDQIWSEVNEQAFYWILISRAALTPEELEHVRLQCEVEQLEQTYVQIRNG